MPVSNLAVFTQAPKISTASFTNAIGTGFLPVYTAGANGTKITAIWCNSNDTINHVVGVFLLRAATNFLLWRVSVPANAGADGITPATDIMGGGAALLLPGLPVDNDGQRYLFLQNGDAINLALVVGLQASTFLTAVAIGADF